MTDGNYTYYRDHFVMYRNAESWCATLYAAIHELYLKNIHIYRYAGTHELYI